MKTWKMMLAACLIVVLLPGCWDQKLLKDIRIIDINGLDLNPDGKLQNTSSVLDVSGPQASPKESNEIHTGTGNTISHLRDILDRQISGIYSTSKRRFILIGEGLAKQGIYPYFDALYRDPTTALNAKIAVVEGTAKDAIYTENLGTKLIGEFFINLIQGMERKTFVPKVNLQLILPSMLNQGNDFTVPYITKGKTTPTISGIALFNNDKMTGTLNPEESVLYLLMADKLANNARLILKINKGENHRPDNYIGIDIQSVKRKLKVNVQDIRNIKVKLDLNLKVTAIEYSKDHLNERQNLKSLNTRISEELTKRAKTITQKIQRANHDGLGVGQRIMAYYPNTWKRLHWQDDYAKVEFLPKVTVRIDSHGIIN
ncbi:Ger(x)C family spore germination protein [Paenibacillus sp.]|jgi:Ger(x)C family germination protein|uniref:Ger(x)C family spore germination protein n=1 Tax=Paenibacillus sp. TaxID=58172 RepID=UPI002833419C|nr:Ger(x)C family spore germination protein [Paenibacillus sp.]MDR0271103.1 Ger(x)C family spore germination protein [Paenibacillus sp.]